MSVKNIEKTGPQTPFDRFREATRAVLTTPNAHAAKPKKQKKDKPKK